MFGLFRDRFPLNIRSFYLGTDAISRVVGNEFCSSFFVFSLWYFGLQVFRLFCCVWFRFPEECFIVASPLVCHLMPFPLQASSGCLLWAPSGLHRLAHYLLLGFATICVAVFLVAFRGCCTKVLSSFFDWFDLCILCRCRSWYI